MLHQITRKTGITGECDIEKEHKSYSCIFCKKIYCDINLLKEHLNSPFHPKCINNSCSCGKQFNYIEELNEHLHIILHINNIQLQYIENTQKCNHCDERFYNTNEKSEHIKIKHPENCIKCSICSQLCISKNSLKNHKKKWH